MKQKACKRCNRIFEEEKCPGCGSTEFTDSFKGRVMVINTEKSEIENKLKLKDKGAFAVKTR